MAKLIANSTLGTATDTYLYSLARHEDAFATIGSDDTLRVFDTSLKLINAVQSAHSGITCLTSNESGFATAGRDGVVRFWDARAQGAKLTVRDSKSRGFSAIASHGNVLAAGTESTKEGLGDVSVLLYDLRNAATPLRNYAESHTDTITQLAFHPTEANVLLSGSTDGLVSLFDVNHEDEDDALQRVLNPRSAIHCAGFLGDNASVYVATTDEHLSMYPLSESNNSPAIEFGDIREKEDCTYIVNVVPYASNMHVIYGNHVKETLIILSLKVANSYSVVSRVELAGAHGEEIVRDFMLMASERKALSCGEDGRVKVWDLAAG